MQTLARAESTPLAQLKPAPWNPRLIKDQRFKTLCRSIEADPEFLWRRPVLAMSDGTIYAGNMRYRAAVHLGWTEIPAIREDVPEQLAKERALRDNSQWGEWQEDDLAALIYELQQAGSNLDLLGFDSKELDRLLELSGANGEAIEDEVPEPPEDPVTRPGDLWLLGEHRVLCGDSTKAEDVGRLLDGRKPELMVTDPPYGVEYDPHWRDAIVGDFGQREARGPGVQNDNQCDWTTAWTLFPGDVAYIWHAGVYATEVAVSLRAAKFDIRSQIIWAKQHFAISRGHYHWKHEPCWYAVRKGSSAAWIGDRTQTTVWEINSLNPAGRQEEREAHGTQKPVECMARPLRNHQGDVYDPFLGSGTTLIAAEQLWRRCYAMEIDPKCVDVAIQRWERLTGKQAMLERAEVAV